MCDNLLVDRLQRLSRTAALAELAGGIAHQINQSLGAIATFSQAATRMLDRPEPVVTRALEVLQAISNEAFTSGEDIRRIRQLFTHPKPVCRKSSMSGLIAELTPVLDALAQAALTPLRVNVNAGLPEVSVDRLQIQLVLFSLVQNALEATDPSEGSEVRVDVLADGHAVETGVSDAGVGIPANMAGRIFRPFFTTKAAGGGLGLASSRAIIEAHEGTIGFDRSASKGSRFWFRLPIAHP